MSKQASTALANALAGSMSWGEAFTNFLLMYYVGAQPATADMAATGVACVRFSKAAGAITLESRATTVIDFTATTGNLTALTIGGIDLLGGATVAYSTPAALATAAAAQINAVRTIINFSAQAVGAVLTITAPKNSGVALNGLAVVKTVAAGTAAVNGGTSATLGGAGATAGVAAVNCLSMAYPPVAGVVSKESAAWLGLAGSGVGAGYVGFVNAFTAGNQTAGWFRCYMSANDPELTGVPTADSQAQYLRFDGTIGTDLTVAGGTILAFGATETQNSMSFTVPTNQG